MDLPTFLIQVLNSVQYGLLLFLLASGLTLIFGIMGVINLAHGSFYMLGAYLAFSLAQHTGSLLLAILIGLPMSSSSVSPWNEYSSPAYMAATIFIRCC
jgi:branched-chain amino acid transport system permease protein